MRPFMYWSSFGIIIEIRATGKQKDKKICQRLAIEGYLH